MRSVRLIAAVLGLGLIAAGGDSTRDQLTKRYAEIAKAFVAGDSAAITESMTPDYVISRAGRANLNRDQVVKGYKSQMAMLKDVKWTRSIESLQTLNGETVAIVTGKFNATFPGEKDKPHTFAMSTRSKDVWVKIGKTWKIRRSTVLKNEVTIDGKPQTRM